MYAMISSSLDCFSNIFSVSFSLFQSLLSRCRQMLQKAQHCGENTSLSALHSHSNGCNYSVCSGVVTQTQQHPFSGTAKHTVWLKHTDANVMRPVRGATPPPKKVRGWSFKNISIEVAFNVIQLVY